MAATFRLLSLKPMTLMWYASESTHGYVRSAWNAPTHSHTNAAPSQLMDLIPTIQMAKIPAFNQHSILDEIHYSDTKLSNQYAELHASSGPSVFVLNITGSLFTLPLGGRAFESWWCHSQLLLSPREQNWLCTVVGMDGILSSHSQSKWYLLNPGLSMRSGTKTCEGWLLVSQTKHVFAYPPLLVAAEW